MNRREFLKIVGAAGTLPLFNVGCAGFGRCRKAQLADGAKTIRYEENAEENTKDCYDIDVETDRNVDLREKAFRLLVDEKCIILRMTLEAIGLEEVFLKLTTEDDIAYKAEQEIAAIDRRDNAFAPDEDDRPADDEGEASEEEEPEKSSDKKDGGDDDNGDGGDYTPMFG